MAVYPARRELPAAPVERPRPPQLLTLEEERRLGRRARLGDAEARKEFVERNQGLVKSVARQYLELGFPKKDLHQAGNVGLVRALNSFNPKRGRFSTWAVPRIRGQIIEAITSELGGRGARITPTVVEAMAAVKRVREKRAAAGKGELSFTQLLKAVRGERRGYAGAHAFAADTLRGALAALRQPVAYAEEAGMEETLSKVQRRAAVSKRPSPEQVLLSRDRARFTHALLEKLGEKSPAQEAVLRAYYGIRFPEVRNRVHFEVNRLIAEAKRRAEAKKRTSWAGAVSLTEIGSVIMPLVGAKKSRVSHQAVKQQLDRALHDLRRQAA
ncbi:MAG: sigma-70 family RNA polymerase sigma factor [Candidatus Micrarchaeota archaeon]